MKEIKDELTVKISGNSYKIKFPDTGTLIDLEQVNSRIQPPSSNRPSELWSYNLALAINTFRFLIPSLKSDMNVESFERLPLKDSSHLVKVYLKDYKPWMDGIITMLSDSLSDDEETSKNNA